jgi:hypothetical protein
MVTYRSNPKASIMKGILTLFLLTAALSFMTNRSSAQFVLSVGISIRTAPPALPVYTQPPCPTDGFLWTPGYWAYDEVDGYYWVPGVWVRPAQPGFLWTPGYWGYAGGIYGWHGGYWGPHIGFYGGVNYGYGYGGSGFVGGEWHGGYFRYNTAVMNVNTTVVHNTYINRTVINNTVVNRTSFNGGGGINARPNADEQVAMRENHVQPTGEQFNHNHTASLDRNQFASANGGRPGTTAMNSVGGTRFSPQGRNAPAAMARPAGGMAAGGHPGNGGGNRSAVAGGAHPGGGGNHGGNGGGNHPANHEPSHGGGGGGEHHH